MFDIFVSFQMIHLCEGEPCLLGARLKSSATQTNDDALILLTGLCPNNTLPHCNCHYK